MRFDFVVLGGTGMQGRIAARDLLENGYAVLLCGRDKSRVEHLLHRFKKAAFEVVNLQFIDKTAATIKKSGASVVVNCAEGDWNLNALHACIQADAHSIDLGSEIAMTRQQLLLNHELKKRKLIHITGCGSVPGVGNVMLRHASEHFDSIDTIEVGFAWDSNIKKFVVPFSIQSIIEEFMDPAAVIKNRKFIKVRPLDTLLECYDSPIGQQESLFVRHPETYTFYHYFKNKGLKNVRFIAEFPKHSFDRIMAIIELGMGSKKEVTFRGQKIRPVDFLTEVLKGLKRPAGYEEKEDLWLKIIGKKNKNKIILKLNCIVKTIPGWEDAGCNIDTGMPASIMGQLIYTDKIKEYGSFAPEAVIPAELFFKELAKRHMHILENGKRIN